MVDIAGPWACASIGDRGYANSEVLVSTEWVAENLADPKLRLLECDEDVLLYDTGHIPGAVKLDWVHELNAPVVRDYLSRERMQRLLRSKGISADTTVVLYGDRDNWWATFAFWVFRLFGLDHLNLKLMDGGRGRWAEQGGALFRDVPRYAEGDIAVGPRNDREIRVFRDGVLAHVAEHRPLVDVRSPEEFRGNRVFLPDCPDEGAVCVGHIPGALNIPWGRAVDADTHCFRPAPELKAVYRIEGGLKPDDDVITYCRIGERSSHTWFVLTYLLGFKRVRNYDGSWTEWGNLVGAPIERS
ncbi:MAG TPA: sulfurtransferase [Gemmatimonadales bacterium]|nr:sulfurtransferase [Gemmatimonadales bacterium]